jgi:DNA replication protein DnaC
MTRRIRDRVINPDEDPVAWRLALERAGIPDQQRRATIGAIREAKIATWAAGVCDNAPDWMGDGIGFYLHGPLNAGKSALAAVLGMEGLRRAEKVMWLPVRDVPLARFREGERGKALDDQLRDADLLILDDLGAERFRLSSAAGPALEETLRIMYDRGRSVVITSNIEWGEFITTSPYAREAAPLVSVIRRKCHPVPIVNEQWPLSPESLR